MKTQVRDVLGHNHQICPVPKFNCLQCFSVGKLQGWASIHYALGQSLSSPAICTCTPGSSYFSLGAARIATFWIMMESDSEKNMSWGSIDVEQSLPQPSPVQSTNLNYISTPFWYVSLVALLPWPQTTFIAFNHIIYYRMHKQMEGWLLPDTYVSMTLKGKWGVKLVCWLLPYTDIASEEISSSQGFGEDKNVCSLFTY